MRIAVPRESNEYEHRVALVPDSVSKLVKTGNNVVVQEHAGKNAGFTNEDYVKAGAVLKNGFAETVLDADVVVKVQRPTEDEIQQICIGCVLVCLIQPADSASVVEKLNERKVSVLALEYVPRIARAQSMDVLSSQATVSGYKSVILAANELPRFFPSLTTAAGSIQPAKVFVIGAGVAGLQALATAKRLGAQTSAFDVRAAAREQVQSVGAKFIAADLVSAEAEDKGGYAKAQTDDEQERTLASIARHIKDHDIVITTALIPGKKAPVLVTAEMVESMKPGSVIVDLAAEAGGNCVLTVPGERVETGGVVVIGPRNLPSTVPFHSSQMFSRNVLTLLQHLNNDNRLNVNVDDEITGAIAIAHSGSVRRS